MPVAKKIKFSIHPTKKARFYLEELGYLDRRNGKIKRDNAGRSLNINDFINKCVIWSCEQAMPKTRLQASSKDLLIAWNKLQIQNLHQQKDSLDYAIRELAEKVARIREGGV